MIGIVADDVTGSNDIGLMFAKHSYRVEIYSECKDLDLQALRTDVLILDTNSRCDDPQAAYRKVASATERLRSLNCRLLYKKTCSAFRGNIGSEFDAMLDTVGTNFAIVVAAFPRNGRITKNGIHFVHGRALEESEFAHDPVHPMGFSDLRRIIAQQSQRPSHLIHYEVVAKGVKAIRKNIEEYRPAGGYVICDVTSQKDLNVVAEAVAQEPYIMGSSAIGEELPHFWPPPEVGLSLEDLPRTETGTLMISGSVTSQTRTQIAFVKEQGIDTEELTTTKLFDAKGKQHEIVRLVNWALPLLKSGKPALIYGSHQPEDIAATYEVARQAGFSKNAANHSVSETLGELSLRIVDTAVVKQLIVAGGETSNDVCRALGIIGNLVLKEIQPGLPSGLSFGKHQLLVVLKSGSFGSPDFLIKTLEHLENLGRESMPQIYE